MEKIKIPKLSPNDLAAISNAAARYAKTLEQLIVRDNTSQQTIHFSILNEFRFELMRKLTKRQAPETTSLKLEVHTAFVMHDALQHYSTQAENAWEGAIIRRLIMDVHALLPTTSDNQTISVMSKMNYE